MVGTHFNPLLLNSPIPWTFTSYMGEGTKTGDFIFSPLYQSALCPSGPGWGGGVLFPKCKAL